MAIENGDIEPVHTADRFIGQLVFDVHRRLIRAWLARRRPRVAPAVHEMLARWLETGQDYAHRWVLDDDGGDLVCADCAQWFRISMKERMTGRRLSEHVPGAIGLRNRHETRPARMARAGIAITGAGLRGSAAARKL